MIMKFQLNIILMFFFLNILQLVNSNTISNTFFSYTETYFIKDKRVGYAGRKYFRSRQSSASISVSDACDNGPSPNIIVSVQLTLNGYTVNTDYDFTCKSNVCLGTATVKNGKPILYCGEETEVLNTQKSGEILLIRPAAQSMKEESLSSFMKLGDKVCTYSGTSSNVIFDLCSIANTKDLSQIKSKVEPFGITYKTIEEEAAPTITGMGGSSKAEIVEKTSIFNLKGVKSKTYIRHKRSQQQTNHI